MTALRFLPLLSIPVLLLSFPGCAGLFTTPEGQANWSAIADMLDRREQSLVAYAEIVQEEEPDVAEDLLEVAVYVDRVEQVARIVGNGGRPTDEVLDELEAVLAGVAADRNRAVSSRLAAQVGLDFLAEIRVLLVRPDEDPAPSPNTPPDPVSGAHSPAPLGRFGGDYDRTVV